MGTPLRIIEAPPPPSYSFWDTQPGDMWPCHIEDHSSIPGRAPCWIVRLPDGAAWWHTNALPTSGGGSYWTVTGEPPNITVQPSINVGPEIWHGHITNGELVP